MGDFKRQQTSRPKFQYKARTESDIQSRATQRGGNFDSYIPSKFSMWKCEAKDHVVRFLPPTWTGARHFGFELFLHYGVGADAQSYSCLLKMKNEDCPLCEAGVEAMDAGDQELADKLTPKKRILVWLIDRSNEADSPFLWSMPWTFDRDLALLSRDKSTGETLFVDEPDVGYDVEFTREGQMLRTKYLGLAVSRRSSPLHHNANTQQEWLDFIVDNPLSEIVQYYEYDHIQAVHTGKPIASRIVNEDEQDEYDDTRRHRQSSQAQPREQDEEDAHGERERDEAIDRDDARDDRRTRQATVHSNDEDDRTHSRGREQLRSSLRTRER